MDDTLMKKLQELLKWLSEQDKYMVENLCDFFVNQDNYFLFHIVGKERYDNLELKMVGDYKDKLKEKSDQIWKLQNEKKWLQKKIEFLEEKLEELEEGE